ncbi:UDP-N-acetylmuramoylalanyl-D-glutamate--2,6-diaminopimelate ligase [Filomicrobium insigne]|uniref:UDP-N-acetylmuramoyl-L-alanyl-D-glutamate--2,6-diaminopimelate ligase n=1 Tax=Filomicrobium insigne TaxID=418854 RepID=A0A1H0MKJ4_9HYPH|nr:UDP-N-acetylmuramoyl-L-alanyl-D-glutamate--2,6-diaminopimelate ligase [Filomicrobium insigne]SDO80988.1 UDP-N-acetylmuramoylalanyl-D-glutamate--2,6-diaminopimelate ligase [Filomicrobium insigne]
MQLSHLLEPEISVSPGAKEIFIRGLSLDSRTVSPGFLFAALPGARADGAQFVGKAVEAGAAAVLVGTGADVGELSVPVLRTDNPRRTLARIAARFYGAQPDVAVAVTGTSGKTSVVEFTRQIFASQGLKAASLGTIGLVKPDGGVYGSLTTPDPLSLHQSLAGLADEGVTHIAFEASSHGLDQHRLDGVKLTAAAFTNLGRDHLDYHTDTEAYFAAKMRLFTELLAKGQPVVINMDGARSGDVRDVARACGLDVRTVGREGETIRLLEAIPEGFAQRLHLAVGGDEVSIWLPLVGGYQVENALVAAGLAAATGLDIKACAQALEGLTGVKGRLDIVGEVRGGLVVVDYAHKPEALAAALDGVRPMAAGRVVCVFGCGGDRDAGKRPIMGAIAAEKADVVIVTDDNPRSESAAAIRAAVLVGVGTSSSAIVWEIGDRREAIEAAITDLGRGDIVVIAGKGHETGQIIGDCVLPFSDHDVAEGAIENNFGEIRRVPRGS